MVEHATKHTWRSHMWPIDTKETLPKPQRQVSGWQFPHPLIFLSATYKHFRFIQAARIWASQKKLPLYIIYQTWHIIIQSKSSKGNNTITISVQHPMLTTRRRWRFNFRGIWEGREAEDGGSSTSAKVRNTSNMKQSFNVTYLHCAHRNIFHEQDGKVILVSYYIKKKKKEKKEAVTMNVSILSWFILQ